MDKKTRWALFVNANRKGYSLKAGVEKPYGQAEWVLIDESVNYQEASEFMQNDANTVGKTPKEIKQLWYTQKTDHAN